MRAWFLCLLFLPVVVSAGQVSLVFDRVPVRELVRVAFGELDAQPYVLSEEFLQSDAVVSLSLRGVPRSVAVDQVREVLRRGGWSVERRGSVVWVGKAPADEDQDFVYRPRHRSVSDLVDLLGGLFGPGAFAHQRGVRNVQAPQVAAGAVDAAMARPAAGAARPRVADSGTSAFSRLDREADALVFRGSGTDVARLEKLLASLDVPVPELLVRAVVYEVSTDSAEHSAVSLAASLVGGRLGLNLGKPGGGDYSGVFKLGGLSVVLDALSSDRRFKVVSSPTLRVRSGSQARLTVGSETPVLGQAQLDRNGNPVQSVEYKPAGVILDLRPEVREGVAELEVRQQLSNFIPTTTGVNNSPTLIKREIVSTVGVQGDEVLMLGGLDEEKTTSDRSGLSFLPSWFRSSGSSGARSEVLLVLQASRL